MQTVARTEVTNPSKNQFLFLSLLFLLGWLAPEIINHEEFSEPADVSIRKSLTL
jgi:hypothetical protein